MGHHMRIQNLVLMGLLVAAPHVLLADEIAPRPNMVLIMADDLGWADVAFHGGNAPTPHLDKLAKEGLELGQHYVAPVCSPTRTGLLTGRCWSRFGVTNPQNELALPFDTITLRGADNRGDGSKANRPRMGAHTPWALETHVCFV
jgi:hypothetical protein